MRRNSIIILKRDHKIPLNLRDNKSWINYPDYWGCIGGGIEKGETPLDAIKREIKEEIDCEMKEITEIGKIIIKNDSDCRDCENIVFLGKIDVDEDSINLKEGKEVRYFDFEEIIKLKIPLQLRSFIVQNKDKIFY